MSNEDKRREKICHLNDLLRTQGIGGKVFTTVGVNALPDNKKSEIINAVREFNNFGPDNDPYGEHDCAVIASAGHSIIWKIDYYNIDITGGSVDPTNSKITKRVMTIMLAHEY